MCAKHKKRSKKRNRNQQTSRKAVKKSEKKVYTKKQKLLIGMGITAAVLCALYLLAEVFFPSLMKSLRSKIFGPGDDYIFYEGPLEKSDEELWEECIKHITYYNEYSTEKVSEVLTEENAQNSFFESYGQFWIDYFDIIKSGDQDKYASLFASDFDFENTQDPYYASLHSDVDEVKKVSQDFEEQRVHNIHIYRLKDKPVGVAPDAEIFEVNYEIFRNTGTFRRDIDDYDLTAPLYVTLKTENGKHVITEVVYKYAPTEQTEGGQE